MQVRETRPKAARDRAPLISASLIFSMKMFCSRPSAGKARVAFAAALHDINPLLDTR